MKKLISLLIAIMTFFVNSAMAVFIPQDVQGTEFEKDVELLINLGLLEYTENGMMKPYSHMKRAEFANFLDGILSGKTTSERVIFEDVGSDHYAKENINRLYEYGYIYGDGNSYFRPEDEITYNEAVRVMVSIMGYDAMAKYQGGYPNGYLSLAGSLGITDGVVPDGEYINKGNVMRLLINCFEANPVEVTFVNGKPSLSVNKESTMLAELTGIYNVRDYINANSDYAVSGEIANDGYIFVGKDEMLAPAEYAEYVGYMAECWYRETDDDEYEVIYMTLVDRKNELIRAEAHQISGYDDYSCSVLFDERKETKIKFDGETIFVYNGKVCTSFDSEMLDIDNGWIEFLDNDADGVCELIKINEYYNMVVESVTDKKIYDKFNDRYNVVLEDSDIRIFDETGAKAEVSYIAKGDILSVFKSGDDVSEDIVKIICSKKTVTGIVKEKTTNDGITYITIGTEKYELYNGYRTTDATDVFLHDSGEFLLDAYGKVVSMKGVATGVYVPSFLINVKAFPDDESGDMIIRFKVLNEQGVMYVKAVEEIKADGIKYREPEFENLGKSLQSRVGQVILYRQNAKGEVTAIDTTEQNTATGRDDRLSAGPSIPLSQKLRWNADTRVIEGQFPAEENAMVFVVPSKLEDAEDNQFAVKNVSSIGTGTYMSGTTTYRLDKDKMTVDYLVIQGNTASMINHQSDIAIITEINTILNEEGDTVLELVLNVYGTEKKLVTSKMDVVDKLKYLTKYSRSGDTLVNFEEGKIPTLGRGDIIKYGLDDKGFIEDIVVVYSAKDETMHSVNPYHTDFHEQGYRYVQGVVKQKYGDYIMLDVNNGSRTECHNIGRAGIFEVDTDNKNIFDKISMSEVKDSNTYVNGDKVIILMSTGRQLMTLVYR